MDSGDIFYVGKGSTLSRDRYGRAYETRRRSDFWRSIASKHGFTPEVVAEFDDESDAFRLEMDLIAYYGRKSDGGCPCNMTTGGEGCSGLAMRQETKDKLRAANSGANSFNLGRKFPKEVSDKRIRSLLNGPNSPIGRRLPKEWCESISRSKSGDRHPMYGKFGVDHHRSRPVFLHGYNIVLGSCREAARFFGVSLACMQYQLKMPCGINRFNAEFL